MAPVTSFGGKIVIIYPNRLVASIAEERNPQDGAKQTCMGTETQLARQQPALRWGRAKAQRRAGCGWNAVGEAALTPAAFLAFGLHRATSFHAGYIMCSRGRVTHPDHQRGARQSCCQQAVKNYKTMRAGIRLHCMARLGSIRPSASEWRQQRTTLIRCAGVQQWLVS